MPNEIVVAKHTTVINSNTGELLELHSASDEQLGQWLDDFNQFMAQGRDAKLSVVNEILNRMDRHAKWTLESDSFVLKGASPAKGTTWDIHALRATLADLHEQGIIDEEAIDHAIDIQVTYKPRASGINAIKKLSTEVAERIEQCSHTVDKTRSVTVKPRRSG